MTFRGLLCTALLVFPAHVQTFRVQSKRERGEVTHANETRLAVDAPDPISFNEVLTTIQPIDPADALRSSLFYLGKVDWREPILPQLQTFALSAFGSILSMANPFLGFAFTVITGLITGGGADPNAELFKQINKMVAEMIKGALDKYYEEEKERVLSGINNLMVKNKFEGEWFIIASELEQAAPTMFSTDCWDSSDPDREDGACKDYRRNRGRGEGLIINIEFVRLLETVYYSLLATGHNKTEAISIDIEKAMPLLYGHLHDWSPVRLAPSNFRRGSWVEGGPGYSVTQGQDSYIHNVNADREDKDLDPRGGGEFDGDRCIPSAFNNRRRAYYPEGSRLIYQQYGRRRAPQDRLNADLDGCRNDWIDKIESEQLFLKEEVNLELQAGTAIVNKDKATWLQHSKYISGGTDGSCPAGYRRATTTECTGLGDLVLPRKQSGSWQREDCMSHFTPGAGCWHNTEEGHTYSTRANCPQATGRDGFGGNYHLALCIEDERSQYPPCGGFQGSRPTSAAACEAAANRALSGIKPRRGMQVGSWGWVPRGCSVQSSGDWAIHFNTYAYGRNLLDYSVVCGQI